MADEVKNKIDSVAQAGIARARSDMGETENIPIPELIAADKYLGQHDFLLTDKTKKFKALAMRAKFPGGSGNE